MIRKSIKSILSRFWSKRIDIDEIQLEEELMADIWHMEEEKLTELMAERKRLKERKKRASHLDAEIVRLRTAQLAREVGV